MAIKMDIENFRDCANLLMRFVMRVGIPIETLRIMQKTDIKVFNELVNAVTKGDMILGSTILFTYSLASMVGVIVTGVKLSHDKEKKGKHLPATKISNQNIFEKFESKIINPILYPDVVIHDIKKSIQKRRQDKAKKKELSINNNKGMLKSDLNEKFVNQLINK